MREKLLTTENASYVPAQWQGENLSGIRPIGDMVLVLPDAAAETAGKLGLIHMPTDQVDRMSLASESGVIVAIGDDAYAWNSDRTRPFAGEKPKLGDHVVFARYAGRTMRGKDDQMYRLMSDNAIGAIVSVEENNV